MEYSFSIRRVSCAKLSFSKLNTSSIRLFFNRREIHTPAANRERYPAVMVKIYNAVFAASGNGRTNSHQFRKNRIKPIVRNT